MSYRDELTKAMLVLAQDERVIFMGQTVAFPGSAIYGTLERIREARRLELPVAEEMQMGMSLGLSLGGYIPCSIYPRADFLILAINQLVNHLDKMEHMSQGQYRPKVIIRTAVGSTKPLYPGVQHCQDHTDALKRMLTNIEVTKLLHPGQIVPAYLNALDSERSSLIVEIADLYDT